MDGRGMGAVVSGCVSEYSEREVAVGSLLVGVGDRVVMGMAHREILRRIRCSQRPLTLTFCPPRRIAREVAGNMEVKRHLSVWLDDEDGECMRFRVY